MATSPRSVGSFVRSLARALGWAWKAAPGWSVALAALTVAGAVLPLLLLLILERLVDAVALGGEGRGMSLRLLMGIGGVSLLALAVRLGTSLATEEQAERAALLITGLLHRQAMRLDLEQMEDPGLMDDLHRALQHGPLRPRRLVERLRMLFGASLSLAGVAVLVARLEAGVAVLLAAAGVVALLIRRRAGERYALWERHRARDDRRAWYLHWLLTSEANAAEIRLHELGPELARRHVALTDRFRRERFARLADRTLWSGLGDGLILVATFGGAAWVLMAVGDGATVGGFVLFLGLLQRGGSALQELAGGLAGLNDERLYLESLDAVLALEPGIQAPGDTVVAGTDPPVPGRSGREDDAFEPMPENPREVSFESVSFLYPGRREPALSGVDLQLRRGRVTALVGENGSGKSTLLRLLTRLSDPSEGVLRLDGLDYRRLDPLALRRLFAVLPQRYGRFHLPARDNVAFGAPGGGADESTVEQAASTAGVAGYIGALPRGWESVLGTWFERGQEPSAGEWQRIALARALAHDGPFLILDEPTAPLDPEAEEGLFETLRRGLGDRALLIVTHRMALARRADEIVVLHRGRVAERGTHEALVAGQGIYAALFGCQAAGYAD